MCAYGKDNRLASDAYVCATNEAFWPPSKFLVIVSNQYWQFWDWQQPIVQQDNSRKKSNAWPLTKVFTIPRHL